MNGKVLAVHFNPSHTFSKQSVPQIVLLDGLGVQGDAHCGVTVKHRSRVARDPSQPNLRQVHLIHDELLTSYMRRALASYQGTSAKTSRRVDLIFYRCPWAQNCI